MTAGTNQVSKLPPKISGFLVPVGSFSILLFLIGVCMLGAVYLFQLNSSTKESIAFFIEIDEFASEAAIFTFQKKLSSAIYTKEASVVFVSREEALEVLIQDKALQKEDLLLFGENLLPDIIRFNISDAYIQEYRSILKQIDAEAVVQEVFFANNSVAWMQFDPYQIPLILSAFILFLIFVLFNLVKNSLKLRLISDKNSIEDLQKKELGFEWLFNPYKNNIFVSAFCSIVIAVLFLIGTAALANIYILPVFIDFKIYMWSSMVCFIIFLIGILVAWLNYQLTIRRYLLKAAKDWTF
jgi:cell division protein FtsX